MSEALAYIHPRCGTGIFRSVMMSLRITPTGLRSMNVPGPHPAAKQSSNQRKRKDSPSGAHPQKDTLPSPTTTATNNNNIRLCFPPPPAPQKNKYRTSNRAERQWEGPKLHLAVPARAEKVLAPCEEHPLGPLAGPARQRCRHLQRAAEARTNLGQGVALDSKATEFGTSMGTSATRSHTAGKG